MLKINALKKKGTSEFVFSMKIFAYKVKSGFFLF